MQKIIYLTCVVFGLILLWMGRYSIVPLYANAYKLDRFTGKVTIFVTNKEMSVEEEIKREPVSGGFPYMFPTR